LSDSLALRGELALRTMPMRRTHDIGSGTAVQTQNGSVSAVFTLAKFDRRRGCATYALRVVNRSRSALVCRTWVITGKGEAVVAYPVLFEIKPFSTTATEIPLWPRDFDSFDRAVAEVAGEGVHCIVEATAPVAKAPRRSYAIAAAASVAVGLFAIVLAAVLRGQVPRIAAFAVPPMALTGTTIEAEYGVFGIGKLSYIVTAPDGRRLQGGPLTDRSGSIPVAIPAANDPGAYTLAMMMDGPLGTAKEVRVLNAIPPRVAGSAQITDISINPVVAKPGQAVTVAYAASGDSGYVRLLDDNGTVWAQKPFTRDGQTEFVVPPLGNGREMRVLLHVVKGRSAAESTAGLVIASSSNVALNDAAQVDGDDSSGVAAGVDDSGANGTFALAVRRVHSGQPISVRILSPRNGMRISLTDPQSGEVSGVDVGAQSETVTLQAPAVSQPTHYTVVANFTDGFGQESVVEPITVFP
jgi:hypothetical protein